MLPAGGIGAVHTAGSSGSTFTLTGASSVMQNGQTVYIVEGASSTQALIPAIPQQNAPKLLLSSVVSMAANSRIKAEPHRGADCTSCEACRARLQKLDELELKQAELEMMMQIYQKKLDLSKRLLDEYHAKEKTFLDNIGKIFNGDQIVRILTGHCQKRRGGSSWDDGTLKKAAKLYFLCSPQGYQEILHLKMPLPSSHTLQNVIQKGRPQPLSPKTSVFDPFASTSDLSSSIALVRRGIVQQGRQKDSTHIGSSSNPPQQLQTIQPQQALSQQPTLQQQQLHQQQQQPPQAQVISLGDSPPTQLQMSTTGMAASPSVLSISALPASHISLGSIGTAVSAGVVCSESSPISKMVPRSVFASRMSSLDIPEDIANLVAESEVHNKSCGTSSVAENDRLHDQEILDGVPGPDPQLVCPEGEVESPPPESQVNNAGSPSKEMSVERAVGACVRALVDQVARPPQTSTVRPRAPYVSILRNPNDPNAPAKYNLVVPRHLLRPGQRIVLKAGAGGAKSSAPTVQIIEPFRNAMTGGILPTSTGAVGVRQLALTNPLTLGGQIVNINKRPVMSPAQTIVLRPQISGQPNQGNIIQGQPHIIEIAGSSIGDLVPSSSVAKRPRLGD